MEINEPLVYPIETNYILRGIPEKERDLLVAMHKNLDLVSELYAYRFGADWINEFSKWHYELRQKHQRIHKLNSLLTNLTQRNPENEEVLKIFGLAQLVMKDIKEIEKFPFEEEYKQYTEFLKLCESNIKEDKNCSTYFVDTYSKERGPGPDDIVGIRLSRHRLNKFLKNHRISIRKKPSKNPKKKK